MADLKSQISTAARELFQRDGIDGVSMRKIANRVGVTAPAIYRHYHNKDELLSEIIRSGLEILQEYLVPALQSGDPYQRLVNLTEAYLEFALTQPEYFDLAFRVPTKDIEGFPEEIERQNWKTFGMALEQVSLCMDSGVLRRDDPVETAVMLWSTLHGLVTIYRMERFAMNEDGFRQIYRNTVSRLFEGLKGG